MIDNTDIAEVLKSKYKDIFPIYGGDGSLVEQWRDAFKAKKAVLPIRNYSRCEKHEEMLKILLDDNVNLKKDLFLKMTLHPLISCLMPKEDLASDGTFCLAEAQIKNKDITSAMRFDVYVNDNKYYSNVIADGIIFSTPLGSTGYWQSLTRMLFREGWGMTFIAPTQGVNSLILKTTDQVKIKFIRWTDVIVACDKLVESKHIEVDDEFNFSLSPENLAMVGYSEFMCFDCRKNRHSTILQNQFIA